MDEKLRQAIATAFNKLPDGCRYPPASAEQLSGFEQEFGPIPLDYRWYLAECGGGVCGCEWVDGIKDLTETHRKFLSECGPDGWRMRGVFVIGWDGAGNPYGIEPSSGRILVEDHNFGGIHVMADSFATFLCKGLHVSS